MKTLDKNAIHTRCFDKNTDVLSDVDLKHYQEDGIILLRGMYSSDDYEPIQRDLNERISLLESAHGRSAGAADDDISEISRKVMSLEEQIPGTQGILYDAMNNAPSMHQFASNPRLTKVIQTLLSPTIAIHERYIILMSLPRSEWHLATWHQDWYYNEGPTSTITVYAPLQPTDEHNGSLQFALGEQHRGILEHGEHDHGVRSKWHSIAPKTVNEFDRVDSSKLDVGDVLLFNSLVPHAPRMNQSDAIRFVINLRYRDLSDPQFLKQGWRLGPIHQARGALARTNGRTHIKS